MDDEQRSVRIEVDPLGGAGLGDAPAPDAGDSEASGRRIGLLVGLVAAVTVAVALFMLRPESGQTAAGTNRQATTTTSTTLQPSTTTTEGDDTTADVAIEEAEGFGPNAFIIGIERAPVGFIALAYEGDDGLAPPIWRSLDGENWERVGTSIEGPPDEPALSGAWASGFSFFAGLERTATGYSTMAIVQSYGSTSGSERSAHIVQLTSENGQQWVVDVDFPEIDANSSFPFALNDRWTVFFEFATAPSVVTSVVDTYIPSLSDVDVCHFDRSGLYLLAYPCSFGSEIRVTASDYSNPDLEEAVKTCLIQASRSSDFSPSSDVRVLDATTSEMIDLDFDRSPLGTPYALSDGTLMLLAAPIETGDVADACAGLDIDLPEERNAELYVFDDVDGPPRITALPQNAGETLGQSFFPSPHEPLDDVAILFGSSELWSVDRFGTWTSIAEYEAVGQFTVVLNGFSTDGRTAVLIGSEKVSLWDFDAAGQIVDYRELTIDARGGGQRILHFSGDDLFISSDGPAGVEYIDLADS